ncbi:hypothetical protein D3OALGA1CA_3472 [Olavius algarvensis associated proteobacterium Delta 3]|nr:hypothetical protein D3OALGB2SA_3830 [Olavius algarvensis associated proteobacterium Delta 3]CAB5134897.1 hypothetical protein D3OALGA1CA_3472 [Olavius algarvensis associated proteobacterium Delta 3]
MTFGHEQLDVTKLALEYVGWVYRFCENLRGIEAFGTSYSSRRNLSL